MWGFGYSCARRDGRRVFKRQLIMVSIICIVFRAGVVGCNFIPSHFLIPAPYFFILAEIGHLIT